MHSSRTDVFLLIIAIVVGVIAASGIASPLDRNQFVCDRTQSTSEVSALSFFPSGGIARVGPAGRSSLPSRSGRCLP